MDPLIRLLQQFKMISPRREFAEHSKMLILGTSQPQVQRIAFFPALRNILNYSGAVALTSVLLFVIFGSISILNSRVLSPALVSGLNTDTINKELDDLNLQLKISEAQYHQNSDQVSLMTERDATATDDGADVRQEKVKQLLDELVL